jgi:molecular chaperone HtpG
MKSHLKAERRQADMPEAEGHSQAFQADVAKLLHLMVHSVYSDRDVFLRELLSNAADACEKLRYEALADPALAPDSFAIRIALDKNAQSLAIEDNGIGMSHQDLTDHLGTIARSGTRAFLDRLGTGSGEAVEGEEGREKLDLIGQFGIGF